MSCRRRKLRNGTRLTFSCSFHEGTLDIEVGVVEGVGDVDEVDVVGE